MFRNSTLAIALSGALLILSLPAQAASLNYSPIPGLKTTSTIFAAQRGSSGGRRNSFTCSGLECTCTGDADCNDMFESGKCGDIASCNDDTGVCKCLILLRQPPKVKKLPGVTTGTELKAN